MPVLGDRTLSLNPNKPNLTGTALFYAESFLNYSLGNT